MSVAELGPGGPHVFWKLYRQKLDTLNNRFNRVEGEDGNLVARDRTIDSLIADYDKSDQTSFELLYAAEQRLIEAATPEFVESEAIRRFEEARLRNIDKIGVLAKEFIDSQDEAQRREALLSVVDELQLSYTREKLNSTARQQSSERLNAFARGLVVITLIVFLFSYVPAEVLYRRLGIGDSPADALEQQASFFTHFHLLFVMWFGVIGAYFSRLISFRTKGLSMDRDALATEFSRSAIFMRLTIGFFSAIIMYLLITSDILSGSLFPNMEEFTPERTAQTVTETQSAMPTELLDLVAAMATGQRTDVTVPEVQTAITEAAASESYNEKSPNSDEASGTNWAKVDFAIDRDLALLLVWSLLAGFSERLIPDRFRALEGRAQEAETPSP